MNYICIENNIVKYCDIVYIRHHSNMIMKIVQERTHTYDTIVYRRKR